MKLIVVVVLIAFVSVCNALLLEGSFLVPLDHFRVQDGRTARFIYVYNLDYYKENGPLMFHIDDPAETYNLEMIQSGLMVDIAKELGAALFTTDIRFFGRNLPTPTTSLEELAYLSVEQIVADIPFFINSARQLLNNDVGQAFLWGGAVGSKFAVYARQKYPHFIDGVWSAGGTFWNDVFTPSPYLTLATNIEEVGGAECAEKVTQAFRQIDELIVQQDDETLIQEFGICRPFNVTDSIAIHLFSNEVISRIYNHVLHYHHPGMTSFCRAMSVIPTDPMRSFSRWIRFTFDVDLGVCSNHNFADYVQYYQNISFESPGTLSGARQRQYLICTQFGNLRTTTITGMFGNRLREEFHQRLCEEAFGPDLNFEQLYLNNEYFRIAFVSIVRPNVSHVIYTNPLLNMWIEFAITKETNAVETFVVNIPGYSTFADLPSMNPFDSVVLHNAKSTVVDTFRNWYRAFNATSN